MPLPERGVPQPYVMPSYTESELEFQDWKENLLRDIEQDVNTERAQGGPSLGGHILFYP